eukprot:3256650-Amphidinium_carterae.1
MRDKASRRLCTPGNSTSVLVPTTVLFRGACSGVQSVHPFKPFGSKVQGSPLGSQNQLSPKPLDPSNGFREHSDKSNGFREHSEQKEA